MVSKLLIFVYEKLPRMPTRKFMKRRFGFNQLKTLKQAHFVNCSRFGSNLCSLKFNVIKCLNYIQIWKFQMLVKVDLLKFFSISRKQLGTNTSGRKRLHKFQEKSAACAVFLARLFFLLARFLGAISMLGWMLTKLVKGLVLLRRVYNH